MPAGSTCLAGGSWGGDKTTPSGSEPSPSLTAGTYTYTLSCTNASGSGSDSVSITVTGAAGACAATCVATGSCTGSVVAGTCSGTDQCCSAGPPPPAVCSPACTAPTPTCISGTCTALASSCTKNGTIDPGEQCDPGPPAENLGGKICADLGFGVGTLKCKSDCNFDTGSCTAPPVVIKFQNPLKDLTFTGLINNIINFLFTIAVIVAPILLVIAGVIFMTAAGDPGKVKTARNMLLWTIVGFAIILISKGLVSVLKGILGI